MKKTLLIVDDDEEIRVQMKWALAKEYTVVVAGDRSEAVEAFRSAHPAVTLLDLGLPPRPNDPEEGLATLDSLRSIDPFSKVIVISGQADQANARRAVAGGAHDILCKPVNTDELKLLVQRLIYVSELETECREHPEETQGTLFEGMLGASPQMKEVFKTIGKVAKSNAAVLVLGESGTGKEMVARAIHRRSSVSDGPFVAINCGSISENLIESELFGYEKGAFTGAQTQKVGLIETAHGGTLFLDEIGDLPGPLQVKLLRFLQEKTIQRVGGREELAVEARVVSATHVDLEEAVREGRFREDLFYRLAVVSCRLPALRERGEDVLLLADDFLKRFSEQGEGSGRSLAPQAREAIGRYGWPGNVRELQNRFQRAVIMADGARIEVSDLELDAVAECAPPTTLREAREGLERELLERAMRKFSGKITAVAKELGVSRPTVYELMDKFGIPRKASKTK